MQVESVNNPDAPSSAQQMPQLCAESLSTDQTQQHVKLQSQITDNTQYASATEHSLLSQEQLYKEHQQRRKKQPSTAALGGPSSQQQGQQQQGQQQHHNLSTPSEAVTATESKTPTGQDQQPSRSAADALTSVSRPLVGHDQQPGTPAVGASTKSNERHAKQPSSSVAGSASQHQHSKHAQRSSSSGEARHKKRLHGVKLMGAAWRARLKHQDVRKELGMFSTGVYLIQTLCDTELSCATVSKYWCVVLR